MFVWSLELDWSQTKDRTGSDLTAFVVSCYCLALLYYHDVMMSWWHSIMLPYYHDLLLSYYHTITDQADWSKQIWDQHQTETNAGPIRDHRPDPSRPAFAPDTTDWTNIAHIVCATPDKTSLRPDVNSFHRFEDVLVGLSITGCSLCC